MPGLGRVYNQRTGFVDYANSIPWHDKALTRDLPLTAQTKHLILRGNCHELLKQRDLALRGYGLLICQHFHLQKKELRAAVETLTNHEDRIEEVLRLVRRPNPRPNP